MNDFRQLNQLTVSSLGLGCMGMSEFYGDSSEKESIEVMHYALDHGINFFDTADIYGYGDNEKLVGKALKTHRENVIVATKFGILRDINNPRKRGINGHPNYVRQSCENSLKRLGVEQIDLFYQHRVDPNIPIEETVGSMSELVISGKVRFIGLSEASSDTIRRANAVHPITALQSEYSLGTRDVEYNKILATTKELNIGFVSYSPLSRALLTNHLPNEFAKNDFRQYLPRFNTENLQHNIKLVTSLQSIADDINCTLAQLSLAWLLHQSHHIVPIPGTKRLKYLKENIAAVNIKLNQPILSEINTIISKNKIVGERYAADIIADHNLNG